MDQTILVRENLEAGGELIRLVGARMPITAAFWLKEHDEPRWHLYLASPLVAAKGSSEGYRIVREVIEEAGGVPGIAPFQIKLVPPSNPLAFDAGMLASGALSKEPFSPGTSRFGGRAVEDVCIYPSNVLDAARPQPAAPS